MTDSDKDNDDNREESEVAAGETETAGNPVGSSATDSSATDSSATDSSATDSGDSANPPSAESTDSAGMIEDELPEEEELTPEIVEEEAIRGDFMLRWAAIFLAVLFGFSQIADTRTLTHVRSGDQMRSNGFLPPAADPFAYSLDGQAAPNPSWLTDHVFSLAYSLGGAAGLTVFKALVAGFAIWLLTHISVRGMPTWWSSVCCLFAVCACSVDFMPITDLFTVLGMASVLLILHRYQYGLTSGIHWKLPVLLAVWGNFDPRAYLGILAVFCFAAGLQWCRSRAETAGEVTGPDVRPLWKAGAVCIVALLINPAPLAEISAVVTSYTTEYPGMSEMKPLTDGNGSSLEPAVLLDGRTEFYSLLNSDVFAGFEFAYVAGIALWLIAAVVLGIARSRDDLPWLITLIVFVLLAIIALHELPAASLVAAAAAGTAAQRWYRRSFRQEYTVETMEVLFSRGGRALTVFGMAFLGFFAVADRLPTRSPIGIGFEADMQTTMDSLSAELAVVPSGSRILNTRITQGDFLNWHGVPCFLDSRVHLYGTFSDDTSPLYRFDRMRRGMLREATQLPGAAANAGDASGSIGTDLNVDAAAADAAAEWKADYEKFGIGHVMIRLAPPGAPAYSTLMAMERNADWVLTSRGPSAAFFARSADKPQAFDILKTAFRDSVGTDRERFDFGREPDFYSKYLYHKRSTASAPLRSAQHYFTLASQLSPQAVYNVAAALQSAPDNEQYLRIIGRAMAGPILTIRSANQALFSNPQDADAYRVLGGAYLQLMTYEQAIAEAGGGASIGSERYLQAVMALRQSAVIAPQVGPTWNALLNLYRTEGRVDLALQSLDRYLEIIDDPDALLSSDPAEDEMLRSLYELRRGLQEQTDDMKSRVDEALTAQVLEDPVQNARQKFAIAQQVASQGFILLALEILNDNIDMMRGQPEVDLLRGELLLEAGEVSDGQQVIEMTASVVRDNVQSPEFAGIRWHRPLAVSELSKAAYSGAIDAWTQQYSVFADFERQGASELQSLLHLLPLVPAVESAPAALLPACATGLLSRCQVLLTMVPLGRSDPRFHAAMAYLEMGDVGNARFLLEGILSEDGGIPLRPLAEAYYRLLAEDADKLLNDNRIDFWEDFQYPEATAADAETKTDSQSGSQPEANAESKTDQ
ncbi:MAG: hypothetical protein KDA89_10695 [Planctomycetaceae bacterium]|nr:hypothetical protein [Planctomycetaceae bacterium]